MLAIARKPSIELEEVRRVTIDVGHPFHGEMSAEGSSSSSPQGEGVPGWSSSPPKAVMRPSRSATVTVSAE
jgi:hypothetical protein